MMTAKRLPNWRSRLAAALLVAPNEPHVWGTHDCFLGLVVPAVIATTGADIGEGYRGRYNSADGAHGVLMDAGFGNAGDLIASFFPEVHPSKLHIGDIAAIDAGDGQIGLGIVTGDRIMVLGEQGQATVRLLRACRGFRVG